MAPSARACGAAGHRGGHSRELTSLQCCSLSRSRRVRLVSSNVLSFCRRSSFCLVRVLMSVQVICFSWKTAGSLTRYTGRREEEVEAAPLKRCWRQEAQVRSPRLCTGPQRSRAGFPEEMDLEGWGQKLSRQRATSGEQGWGAQGRQAQLGWASWRKWRRTTPGGRYSQESNCG